MSRRTIAPRAGVVLAADVGAHSTRLAVADLCQDLLAEQQVALDLSVGPEKALDVLTEQLRALLRSTDITTDEVKALVMGLPGPVDPRMGMPVRPPIMPGWDGFPVREALSQELGCPVMVDNDVNLMAMGEQHAGVARSVGDFLCVKIGTGIGCGIIAEGHVHRGADGSAGDIGHIHVPEHDEIVCHCGNHGCLEAFAGGGAMAARLAEKGLPTRTSRDVVDQVRAGQPEAVQLIRRAGRTVGGVLATCVNVLNPAVIVIGGDVGRAGEPLLAGIRECVYRRSPPLATGRLRIVPSQLEDEAGIIGAAVMVIERILSPAAVDASLVAAAS